MARTQREEATTYVKELADGGGKAARALFPLLQKELRALAEGYLRRERDDHTLQPTALVNEAYLRLVDASSVDANGRTHFLAIAARVMRQVLIQHARAHRAKKRGGEGMRITLDEGLLAEKKETMDLIDIDEALQKLSRIHRRPARVVELRFFGGLKVQEVATLLNVGETTVLEDWRFARSWLRRAMSGGDS